VDKNGSGKIVGGVDLKGSQGLECDRLAVLSWETGLESGVRVTSDSE